MLKSTSGNDIPLKSQNLTVNVCDRTASFSLEQNYVNEDSNPIEAFYTFPTPSEASVYSFEAGLDDGTVIVAECKEKNKAKKEYNQAIESGNTAYYMDRSDGNVFSVAVGNLAPLTGVQIRIKFVCELDNEENFRFLRLNIPLTISTKYTPSYQRSSKNFVSSVANPPKTSEKPYAMNISGSIRMSGKLESVDSKTHKIKLSQMRDDSCRFEIQDLEDLNKDVVITIERGSSISTAFTQELPPSIKLKDETLRYCTAVNLVPNFSMLPPVNVKNCRYILLLDTSGSMDGPNIKLCRQAAQNFVALIPMGATFDVYTFDSSFKKFESSTENEVERKKEASEWIDTIKASGGTELFPVLKEIFTTMDKRKNCVLVVISDGDISNTHDVLKLVHENPSVSVFSVGIGSSVSQDLIKGLAVQGHGHAEFIGSGDKNVIGKVRAQLQRAKDTLRKHQNDYRVEIDTMGGRVINVPSTSAPLYEQNDNTYYVFSEFRPAVVRFVTVDENGYESVQTLIPESIECDAMIHRIAGVKLLNELQTAERFENEKTSRSKVSHMQFDDEDSDITKTSVVKGRMIDVSTDLNILSKYTAFIGVENKKDKITGDMTLKEIPLQIPEREENDFGPALDFECAFACASVAMLKSKNNSSSSSECEDLGGGLFGGDDGWGSSYPPRYPQAPIMNIDISQLNKKRCTTPPTTPPAPVLVITVPLDGVSLGGGLITSSRNESLSDLVRDLLQNITLKIGDVVQLVAERDTFLNGFYEILGLGSGDEPWVIQLVN